MEPIVDGKTTRLDTNYGVNECFAKKARSFCPGRRAGRHNAACAEARLAAPGGGLWQMLSVRCCGARSVMDMKAHRVHGRCTGPRCWRGMRIFLRTYANRGHNACCGKQSLRSFLRKSCFLLKRPVAPVSGMPAAGAHGRATRAAAARQRIGQLVGGRHHGLGQRLQPRFGQA